MNKNKITETWHPIKYHPEKYQISNYGRVRSLYRDFRGRKDFYVTPKIMATSITNYGYRMCNLRINNKDIKKLIHRLLAEIFIPNPLNLPFINHKDGNKLNNSIDNLEWCTQKENIRHAFKTGLIPTARGENAGKSKLTEKQVIDIYKSNAPGPLLAKKYKVWHSAIYNIKNHKTWVHVTSRLS